MYLYMLLFLSVFFGVGGRVCGFLLILCVQLQKLHALFLLLQLESQK